MHFFIIISVTFFDTCFNVHCFIGNFFFYHMYELLRIQMKNFTVSIEDEDLQYFYDKLDFCQVLFIAFVTPAIQTSYK